MVDIPGNIRANMAQVPRASNLLANKTDLQGQKTQNALGRQSLQMGKQTMRANEQAIGANALSQQNQVMSMVHQLGASIGEAALQDPNALPMLQQELVRLGQPEDKVQSLSDPRALETFVNASKAAVGGAYGLPGALTNTSLPSDVRSNLYWQSLTPEQQQSELARRRALQLTNTGAGTEAVDPVTRTTTGPLSPSATAEAIRARESADAAAVTSATEAAETEAIPERTRVETIAQDYAAAPRRLQAARDLTFQVQNLQPVFDRVLNNSNMWTVGFMSSVAPPGSPAADMKADLNTLGANAAFDRLQQMRDSSQTGGALGQVSERELALLQSAVAAIEQSQSPEQFRENLLRLRENYARIEKLSQQAQNIDRIKVRIASLQNRPQSQSRDAQIVDLQNELYQVEDELWDSVDETGISVGPQPGNAETENSQPVQISSDEEWENLPSGAQYLDPNGTLRTKR